MTMRCRQCDNCLQYRAWLWTGRACAEIAASSRSWFGTMTLAPSEHLRSLQLARVHEGQSGGDLDFESADYQFGARHREISRWITTYVKRVRKAAGAGLRLMVVCEAHKSGLPHYHALLHETADSKASERLLRRQWVHGFSMFKLVEKDLAGKAAWYVAKYLNKSTRARVRASVDYGQPGTSGQPHRTVAKAEGPNALQPSSEGTCNMPRPRTDSASASQDAALDAPRPDVMGGSS